jgi:hypothetical protein
MNFKSIDSFVDFGFVGGKTIARLQANCKDIPETRGIYLIARTSTKAIRFLPRSTGGHFKQRNPSVSVEKLQKRWLSDPAVLYLGKAGASDQSASLRGRPRSYMQFGLSHPCSHWGGRYIWQLADTSRLLVFWKETLRAQPAKVEAIRSVTSNKPMHATCENARA